MPFFPPHGVKINLHGGSVGGLLVAQHQSIVYIYGYGFNCDPAGDGRSELMKRKTTPNVSDLVVRSVQGRQHWLVGVTGFEPATSASRTRRSSQTEPHPVFEPL